MSDKIYNNMIEISKDDYHAIRDIGIGMYCVVVPKDNQYRQNILL